MPGFSTLEAQQVTPRSRWAALFWPEIVDLASARSAARQGFWVTISLILLSAGYTVATISRMIVLVFLLMVVYIGFLSLVAVGIWFMSRVAAGVGFTLYALLGILSLLGGGRGGLLVLAFALAYGNAVRGTFAYHRIRREERAGSN